MNVRSAAKSFIGKITAFKKIPTSNNTDLGIIEIVNEKKWTFIGGIPNFAADFVNEKANVVDVVQVYYFENGPHACNYIYVYELDKLERNVISVAGNPAPPISAPNK